ncbi:hypothetical protein ACHQDA_08460 [Vibrio fluvialis]|uniref:hypothetical protein n=1 Tax=Vibrio fluvialis TaxID=676 RepID=UPI001C9BC1FF|nr:hypothetical protein [Vibrio fluvialis]MBY8189700.1 hypothetical protein [Vibrio fluvialis]
MNIYIDNQSIGDLAKNRDFLKDITCLEDITLILSKGVRLELEHPNTPEEVKHTGESIEDTASYFGFSDLSPTAGGFGQGKYITEEAVNFINANTGNALASSGLKKHFVDSELGALFFDDPSGRLITSDKRLIKRLLSHNQELKDRIFSADEFLESLNKMK